MSNVFLCKAGSDQTILTGPDACREELGQFTARHGFPMIAKPRFGSASQGVRVLLEETKKAI